MRPLGFNVIGHVSGNFGLGIAARNTVALLLKLGYPVAIVDVESSGGEPKANTTYQHLELAPGAPLPHSITLYHMNPIEIRVLLGEKPSWFAGGETLNVALPYWELPRIPVPWEPILAGMDAVVVPTSFVGDAVRAALPDATVIEFPQAIALPDGIRAERSRWDIPDDAFAVFTAFHTGSGIARKNPMGALDAFHRAFADDPRALLVVKMTTARPGNPFKARAHEAEVAEVRRAIHSSGKAMIIEESLPYRDVLGLYASCDTLLSLHRSEGLGLHLMEAMALERTVVATDWSATTEFMTPENSVPVPYRLVPVSSTPPVQHAYSREFVGFDLEWAEPDTSAAAKSLATLSRDKDGRRALGAHARQDMSNRYAEYLRGEPMHELVALLEAVRPSENHLRESAQRLASQWRFSKSLWAKRMAKKALGRG